MLPFRVGPLLNLEAKQSLVPEGQRRSKSQESLLTGLVSTCVVGDYREYF